MLPEEDWVHCTVSVAGASCTISHDAVGRHPNLADVLELVVKPALLGLGFHTGAVESIAIGDLK